MTTTAFILLFVAVVIIARILFTDKNLKKWER